MDFYTPNIENEATYIEFIGKTINSQLPDHLNDSELFELFKMLCGKNNVNESHFSPVVYILLRRQLLQNHLILNSAMMKS